MFNNLKARDIVSQKIIDLIFTKNFKKGEKLPSATDISKQLDVSTTIAREAYQNLESIGLVRIVHGKGIFVTDGGEILEEIIETRKLLECYNVELASNKINPSDIEKLKNLIEAMRSASQEGNNRSFTDLDHKFHLLLAMISGNRFLYKALDNMRTILFYQQTRVNRYPGNMDVASEQHTKIVDALENKSPGIAKELMAKHLEEAHRVLKKSFDVSNNHFMPVLSRQTFNFRKGG